MRDTDIHKLARQHDGTYDISRGFDFKRWHGDR